MDYKHDQSRQSPSGADLMTGPVWCERFSYLLFPALFGGAMLAWVSMWKLGGWNGDVALSVVYWGFFFVLLVLERVYPFERAWNKSDGQIPSDIFLSIVTI